MRTLTRRNRLTLAAAAALGFMAAGSGAALAQAQLPPEVRALAQACLADFNQLCPGVQPGGGRVLACLQSRADKLTPRCRDALPIAEALKAKALKAGALPQ